MPAGIPADKSKAETRIVADAKENSVQGRVRVIGKGETRLMFFVACLVPENRSPGFGNLRWFAIAAAA
jgi:hypothetical protein